MSSSQPLTRLGFENLALESKDDRPEPGPSQGPREESQHQFPGLDVAMALKEGFLTALNPDMVADLDMRPARETEALLAFVSRFLSDEQRNFLSCARRYFAQGAGRESNDNIDPRGRLHTFIYGARNTPNEITIYKAISKRMHERTSRDSNGSSPQVVIDSIKEVIEQQASDPLFKKLAPNFICTTQIYDALLLTIRRPLLVTREGWLEHMVSADFKFVCTCFKYSVSSSRPVCMYWFENGGKMAARYAIERLESYITEGGWNYIMAFMLLTIAFWSVAVEDNQAMREQITVVIKRVHASGRSSNDSRYQKTVQLVNRYFEVIQGAAEEDSVFQMFESQRAQKESLSPPDGVEIAGIGMPIKLEWFKDNRQHIAEGKVVEDIYKSVDEAAVAALEDLLEEGWNITETFKSVKLIILEAHTIMRKRAHMRSNFVEALRTQLNKTDAAQKEQKLLLGLIVNQSARLGIKEQDLKGVMESDMEITGLMEERELLLNGYASEATEAQSELTARLGKLAILADIIQGVFYS